MKIYRAVQTGFFQDDTRVETYNYRSHRLPCSARPSAIVVAIGTTGVYDFTTSLKPDVRN